jgi:hypothetical protein
MHPILSHDAWLQIIVSNLQTFLCLRGALHS